MRILHILGTDRMSGAERVHLDILNRLKDENEVYYASPDGDIMRDVKEAGVNFIPFDPESSSNIKALVRELSPDVVHASDPRMSFKCARAGVPFISHLHANCTWMGRVCPNSAALAYAAKRAEAVIAVSESIPDSFVFKRAMKKHLYVLPNAVDKERVLRLAEAEHEGVYDLVFVGRLSEVKRPLLFLKIYEKLKELKPDATAAMVGDGELRADVEKYIRERGITGVTLFGFDPNPYRIMARSRVMIVTSEYEGFGLVAVEAMTLGVPVIAFPSGGITEIAGAGGFISNTSDEAANLALALLRDGELYAKASRRAAEASHRYTDVDGYIEKIKEIYRTCVTGRNK